MPQYLVTIRDSGSYLGCAEVYVEASTPEAAEEKAVEKFNATEEPAIEANDTDIYGVELLSPYRAGFADGAVFASDRPRGAA
jgi:hypothetical protein